MMKLFKNRRRTIMAAVLLTPFLAVPAVLVAQDVLTMSDDEQKDWLTSFVQDRLSTPERQIRLSNIDGALGSDVSVRQITIADEQGVWLRVNNARLNWNQAALFTGKLDVRTLAADSIEYLRNAVPAENTVDLPAPEAGGFEIPDFPVAIQLGELSVPKVTFGESVFGLGSEISLTGALSLEGGNLDTTLDIVRLDGPGGTLGLKIDYKRADNVIDLSLDLNEPANGVLANLLSIEGRPAMQLTLQGQGPVADLTAQMQLLADGQSALSGTATIAQQAEGFAIAANLGGPLSTLVAEPYRAFFGADTRLTAQALLRSAGGVELSNLTLNGGQLALTASATTTADNFLSRLVIDAAIADPAGGVVTLPVAGNATKVNKAQFKVDFGTAGSEDWTAELGVDGFSTDDIRAERLALAVNGVASNLSDPPRRMVTFNGDGTLSGVTGDAGLEAALGDSVGLGIAGLWNAGQPIQLAELRVVGEALVATLSGTIDGTDFDGRIGVETGNIGAFSGLAGRELTGALSLVADGKLMPVSGGFDLRFDGTGTNLSIDDATAASVLLKGLTARYLLRQTYVVGPETVLLFHAAAGGVGSIAVQWASALGATVIGTAGGPEKVERARKLGCDHVIDYRTEDFVARVGEITKGAKCDVVYDSVGKDTFPASLDCIKPRGLFVSFGNSSGAVEAFEINLLQRKGSLYATRPTLGNYVSKRAELVEAADDLFSMITSGAIRVDAPQTFALAEVGAAQTALEERRTHGSVVLIP